MDSFVDERDFKILEDDKYTFFMLRRIIGGRCKLLLTDHERLIICYTSAPFPIWIWTPDDASREEMEKAYQVVAERSFFNGGYHFNLKYDLAKFFIERAAADGKMLSISTNMFAYDCQDPVEPTKIADGLIRRCSSEDLDELVDFMDLFHKETGIDQKNRDGYRMDAEAFIKTGNMFLWKDKHGNNVASCMFASEGNMASLNLVFTRPEFRRRHYAENLVYQVGVLSTTSCVVSYCSIMIQFTFNAGKIRDCVNNHMFADDFRCILKEKDLFEMVRLEEIDKLNVCFENVKGLKIVAADGATNYMRECIDAMDDATYDM